MHTRELVDFLLADRAHEVASICNNMYVNEDQRLKVLIQINSCTSSENITTSLLAQNSDTSPGSTHAHFNLPL